MIRDGVAGVTRPLGAAEDMGREHAVWRQPTTLRIKSTRVPLLQNCLDGYYRNEPVRSMNIQECECPTLVPTQMGLYQRVMGAKWTLLHETLRHLHSGGLQRSATGKLRVRRNSGLVARIILKLASLPSESEATPTILTVRVRGTEEEWERYFSDLRVVSIQQADGPLLIEAFGRLAIFFRLEAQNGGLQFVQERAQIRLGALRVAVPSLVAPEVSATEVPVDDNGFWVNVSIKIPAIGFLLAYEGLVHFEADL
jgi:Domain of unknown function (DUF4166)